jgi:N-acetylneuraminic acid mutarotase
MLFGNVVPLLLVAPLLSWARLPDVPDVEGFAGSFAGTSENTIILAGGANFPAGRPWEGGAKAWHDRVFILLPGARDWKMAARLAGPLAYGASVTHGGGVVCIGGSDAASHHATVSRVWWDGQSIQTDDLPPLPNPLAFHCGALIGDTIFIAGGAEFPHAVHASRAFLSLDLADPDGGWEKLPSWPGQGRMLATAGVVNGSFYLFGGTDFVREGGTEKRLLLRDAYCYDPAIGWRRLPDMPRPAVGSPSPSPFLGGRLLAVLGGDDGSMIGREGRNHTGFCHDILGFDLTTHHWRALEELPFSLVTTPVIECGEEIIIPGGECQPGVRSTAVWRGTKGNGTSQ